MMTLVITEIGMLLAFIVGFIMGQNKEVSINPVKIYKKKQEEKILKQKSDKENEDLAITMANINNYDGTGANQRKYNG